MITIASCSGDGKYLESKVLHKLNKLDKDIYVLTEVKFGSKSVKDIEISYKKLRNYLTATKRQSRKNLRLCTSEIENFDC